MFFIYKNTANQIIKSFLVPGKTNKAEIKH